MNHLSIPNYCHNAQRRGKRHGIVGWHYFLHDSTIQSKLLVRVEDVLKALNPHTLNASDRGWYWATTSHLIFEFKTLSFLLDNGILPEDPRFALLVSLSQIMAKRSYSALLKSDPLPSAACLTRIKQEAVPKLGSFPLKLRSCALRLLARVTEMECAALLAGLNTNTYYTVKDLNVQSYLLAKTSPEYRISCLPLSRQWAVLSRGYPMPDASGIKLNGFRMGTYLRMATRYDEWSTSLTLNERDRRFHRMEFHGYIYRLVHLYRDEVAINRVLLEFINARSFSSEDQWVKAIHDAAQFRLPYGTWTPLKWSSLVMKHHRECMPFINNFDALEKEGWIPTSLTQLREFSLKLKYPLDVAPVFEPFRDLCIKHHIDSNTFSEALAFLESTNSFKSAEFLPNVEVDGATLGFPGYHFKKLSAQDWKGSVLGGLSGCCQSVGSAGSRSAKAGFTSPFSSFYVLSNGTRVIAQSWAWRSLKDTLVFDSIESLYQGLDNVIAAMYHAAAQQIVGRLGISAVMLGDTSSGVTREVATQLKSQKLLKAKAQHTPVSNDGYFDGLRHYLIAGTPGPSVKRNTLQVADTRINVHGFVSSST